MPLGIVSDVEYEKNLGGINVTSDNSTHVPEKEEQSEDSVPSEISKSNESETQNCISGEVIDINRGRGKGNTAVPNSVRKLIGESVVEEGRPAGLAIAAFLGVSNSSVSAYAKGATSTASYNEPKKELVDFLGETRKKITKRAAGKLMKSLNVIDEDRLDKLDAVEASNVAKNMSAIIKHMEPPQERNNGVNINMPRITFYAPHIVSEDKFHVVNANE